MLGGYGYVGCLVPARGPAVLARAREPGTETTAIRYPGDGLCWLGVYECWAAGGGP